MEWKRFFEEFQDHLAPKLDSYEQAIYLYVVRHSRLQGSEEAVIAFKSARHRLARGSGTAGQPMSERTAYEKFKSLAAKGAVTLVASERNGTRMRAKLPSEIPGVVPAPAAQREPRTLEDLDFFEEEEMRDIIFSREGGRCF
jgi:hypothetical protein